MDHHRDLEILLEAVSELERAVSLKARPLDSSELSELMRLGLEAKQVLSAALGNFNDFSNQIQSELNNIQFGFLPKPNADTAQRIHSFIRGGANQIHRKAAHPSKALATEPLRLFVSPSRIAELRALPKGTWDLQKLIRLAEELNLANKEQCHMATAMLVRAIADHVPPIFGHANFEQVANNLQVTKSTKLSFQRLQGSLRNIADAHLHSHIRKQEVLPTAQQVDFRQDLDVLLAEVVRVMR